MNSGANGKARRGKWAFSLIEMMVSMAIVAVIMGALFLLTDATGKIWKNTSTKIDAFQSARAAFDEMTRQIAQSTLNTYYSYYDASGTLWNSSSAGAPAKYDRYSELHFVCGPLSNGSNNLLAGPRTWSGETPGAGHRPTHGIFFQAPLGYSSPPSVTMPNVLPLDRLLNACGFYIEYNSDKNNRPSFLSNGPLRYRYRLMKLLEPTQALGVYDPAQSQASGFSIYTKWFQGAIDTGGTTGAVRPLAENIIALIILPEESPADTANSAKSLTDDYLYDTRDNKRHIQLHQLPPMVRVTMVAVDEPSAARLCNSALPYTFVPAKSSFTDPGQYEQDMTNLKENLSELHVNYRVFSTHVIIQGAKWSQE